MKITFSVLGRLLGAALVLAINPSVTHAAFVGPTMITIDGSFTDWTNNVYSQIDGYTPQGTSGEKDLTTIWSAMSTASGGSTPAGSGNLIQNVYFRVDTAATKSTTAENYWFQVNLGTAPAGYADHVVQFFVDTGALGTTADPIVKIVLYQYSTYPLVGALTTGGIIAKVANYAVTGAVNDPNAIGVWALNSATSTYGFEAKIPIGWYGSTYGGLVAADGTGASLIASAVFSTSGNSIGSVGTVKDTLDDASQNVYIAEVNTIAGSISYKVVQTGGGAYLVGAAATTLTPVAGAADTITLTVTNTSGAKDTTFTGAHNVIISGYSAAPNGSYGSFNNVTLTTLSQTNSVNFVLGVATPSLILNKAATQIIGFSLPDLTYPAANNLTITPTAATASQLVVTTQPSASTVAGVAFAQQPVVKIADQFGNVVTTGTDATRVVTVALTTGSGTLSGTLTKTAVAGVADFSGQNLSINLVGTNKVLTMSATITAGARTTTTSPAFTITADALDHFAISTISSPQTAGTAFAIATITAQDVNSNTVTTFVSTVALTETGDGAGGTVSPATSSAFTAGVLSGQSVTLSKSGAAVTITATGSAKTGVSGTFLVNPGPMAMPMTVTRTAGLTLKIAWSDVKTNWSESDGGTVTLSGINLVTTNQVHLTTNSTWIFYINSPNVDDQITYTISDGQSRMNTGVINVVINPFVTGQDATVTVSNNMAIVTFYGKPTLTYVTQRSTNVVGLVDWVSIATNTVSTNGVITVTDTFGDLGWVPPSSAYYRLGWSP